MGIMYRRAGRHVLVFVVLLLVLTVGSTEAGKTSKHKQLVTQKGSFYWKIAFKEVSNGKLVVNNCGRFWHKQHNLWDTGPTDTGCCSRLENMLRKIGIKPSRHTSQYNEDPLVIHFCCIQYSPDNLTLTNSHLPDNLHDCPGHNSS